MKKILIIYNSGAGSTKMIVDIYGTLLEKYQVDIIPASVSFDYSIINKYKLIIFGFPCYHCSPSPLMEEFLEKMPPLSSKKKAFVFITYGLYAGNTIRTFINKCKKKNIYTEDYADYRAPATDGSLIFPPFKFMYKYERNIAANILQDIEKIKNILSVEDFKCKLPHIKLYTLLNYPNKLLGKKSRPQINVRKDACNNCHLCINNCPRSCWDMGESYPVFDKLKCDACYKCIHQCPQEALVFSRKTINKKRLNPFFFKEWKDEIMSKIRNESLN